MRRVALIIATVAAVSVPSLAAAQAPGAATYQPPPPPPPTHEPAELFAQRAGFTIGVTLGPGNIGVADSSGDVVESFDGVAMSLSIGGMLSPRLALVGDLWNITHMDYDQDFRLQHGIITVALQYWLTPRLWAKGGIGRARYAVGTIDYKQAQSDEVPAVMGAVGYELSHGRSFAFDAQLRFGVGSYDEGDIHSGALVLGLNWY